MDYSKGNIVVSRKAILEEKQKIKSQILEKSQSNSVVSGKVKLLQIMEHLLILVALMV